MKKKLLLLLPILGMLFACTPSSSTPTVVPGREYGDSNHYALYMYNYPRVDATSPNGLDEKTENLLYKKVEITLGQKLIAPEDPTREKYNFAGWFKEKKCENMWDFENDVATSSILLYARWTRGGGSEEEVEPEYIVPETIITDANYRVTGILNEPINNGTVSLPRGAIRRLENSPEDVKFAVNYERKEGVSLSVATYDVDQKAIHLEASSGETFDFTVIDKSVALDMSNINTTYENKARKYEEAAADFDNYHIMLGGSSSMEFWETSYEDMLPVITKNHGIGGTTVEQWTNYLFERLFLPYSPKAVVYYVGVNDIINGGKDGDTTGNNLVALFNKTHQYLPNAQIFYVLINKLPGFLKHQEKFDIANGYALNYGETHSYLTCIDAGKDLLKESGNPHAGYFRPDGLHMSKYGYVIWGAAVKQAILEWLNK